MLFLDRKGYYFILEILTVLTHLFTTFIFLTSAWKGNEFELPRFEKEETEERLKCRISD